MLVIFLWLVLIVILIFGLTALIGAPYVPSHRSVIEKAFSELRPLDAKDLLVDIGSGDGAVLNVAARHGARCVGIEINPILVFVSKLRTRRYRHLVQVRLGSFWQVNFPTGTTVVYTFGESRDINKMHKRVQSESNRLNQSFDFISYGFGVADTEPDKVMHGLYLYRVDPLQPVAA